MKPTLVPLVSFAAALLSAPSSAQCPSWDPGFAAPALGPGHSVEALEVFDDGSGPALYAGGVFHHAGAVTVGFLARWDGSVWSPVGSPVDGVNYWVDSLEVFDDGGGPALYVGGRFNQAGGAPASHVARWDGTSWSPLGPGILGSAFTEIRAMKAFDDGSGPALYVAGDFGSVAGQSAKGIARWNGTTWSGVGAPVDGVSGGYIEALEVFDDGSGPALYAGGTFGSAGGAPARRVARWDGASWSTVGAAAPAGAVHALALHDDGSGPALYAGVGGGVARWDGVAWTSVATGSGSVLGLQVYDDGAGARLFAAGSFAALGGAVAHDLASWDGVAWSPVGSPVEGTNGEAYAQAVFDAGSGPELYVGGFFSAAGGTTTGTLARWNGQTFSGTNPTGAGLHQDVYALGTYVDENGANALYAAGRLSLAGSALHRVARWTGAGWSPVGTAGGLDMQWFGDVFALAPFGGELYAGGSITEAAGVPVGHVARWTGGAWQPLAGPGDGTDGDVHALATFDDGGGDALYVGGGFGAAGGATANHVARWDGVAWSALGAGLDGAVRALCVFDDGSGPALYAGGAFTHAGGATARRVARWDGASWSAVGSGFDAEVFALAVVDDGTGPALHAGGAFTGAGPVAASRVARWNGSSWTALGAGVDGAVHALASYDDGSGPALYAGGAFLTAGGAPAERIARWDGASWSPVGPAGIDGVQHAPYVAALLAFDDGVLGGPDLYVGGRFSTAGGLPSFHVARWGNCESAPALCYGDGSAVPCPCGNAGLAGHGCDNSAGTGGARLESTGSPAADTLVLSQAGELDLSLSIFLQGSAELANPVAFGDGLRCAGGTLRRLYVANAVGGVVSAPGPGDPSIRAQSAALGDPLTPGSVRIYQVYYRDPALGFCPAPPGSSFNVGNALRVTW